MKISFDELKRLKTLHERGLDFARAGEIFDGPEFTDQDFRFDYPEPRFQTYGYLRAEWLCLRGHLLMTASA